MAMIKLASVRLWIEFYESAAYYPESLISETRFHALLVSLPVQHTPTPKAQSASQWG